MVESDPKPSGYFRAHVFCCTNQRDASDPRGCCHDRGGTMLRNYMKAKAKKMGIEGIRINNAGCLDRCEEGPTMVVYPDGAWYRCETREDVDEVLQSHLVDGVPVARLLLPDRET
ncbi:MAG: (2Fe-2S) ferredoxin domain-containing protein [Alphaproteobacteria bacterium]|nr:(2Fe-2S) ferredoxin domain-containing protein [Alphaproteobacteria bacterium]